MRTGIRCLILVAVAIVGCTIPSDTVGVTANIDVIRPCYRIGMVEISKEDRFAAAHFQSHGGRGTDWLPTLKRLAYEKGADTLFFQKGASSGEAYFCGRPIQPHQAPHSVEPRDLAAADVIG